MLKMSVEQRMAVTCGMGPVLITAGPGSGKTFTITHRILHLIQEKGCSPHDIYVITFTKDAALSMNKRYQEILSELEGDTADLGAVHFGTFHSFYYQIIRSHPKYRNYNLINTSGRSGILFQVLKNMGKEGLHGKEYQSLLADISFYKNTGRVPEGQGEDFPRLVQEYDREKGKAKGLDFDDMLTLCCKLLKEDASLRRTWQERVGYLLVDEFQDINAVQYEAMKLLIKEPYNVCVVGDDDQAIYGFRGSYPGIMQEFLTDYPETEVYHLGTNYRCSEEIVKLASNVIKKNKLRMEKALMARKGAGKGEVFIRGADSYGKMTGECVEELKNYSVDELSETAVLFRTNIRMNLFLTELIKNGIPFRTKEQITSVYEHFVVKDMMDYLRAAAGCRERSVFLRILNKPRTHIGREALQEEVDLENVMAFYGNEGIRDYEALRDARRFKSGLENLKKLKLSLGIDFILHYFGYGVYLRNKTGNDMGLYEEWMGIVLWLKEDSKAFRDVKEWEQFQKEYISKARKQCDAVESREGVNIMTLHGCKGLEFQKVHIMHVNEGNIPNVKRGEVLSQEALEEERRLFYVGMTRAKETLEIHYVKQTQESPKSPSRFLKELQN